MAICPHCQTNITNLYDPCPTGDGFYGVDNQEYSSFKDDPFLGKMIAERFIVSAIIGHGSIGRVYKGHQVGINRDIVLKIFKFEHILDSQQNYNPGLTIQEAREDAKDRFIREARVLGQMTHPNCVTIFDFGAAQDGSFLYIAMEHCVGISMRQAVKRGLRYDAMIDIMRQTLMALREAHMLGVIHRDLKPENIILSFRKESSEPFVKVLDFGIAKLLHRDSSTSSGMLFGTPAYMSPEQCRGETSSVGAAADIYSLGCMFYELVCGRLPFPGKNPSQMIIMHTEHPIPALQPRDGINVPEGLATFIQTCLSKDHTTRYANAKIALDSLDEALNEGQIKYRATSTHLKDSTLEGVKVPDAVLAAAVAQSRTESAAVAQNVETIAGAPKRRPMPQVNMGMTIVAPEHSPKAKQAAQKRNYAVGIALFVVFLFCSLVFGFIYKAIMAQ